MLRLFRNRFRPGRGAGDVNIEIDTFQENVFTPFRNRFMPGSRDGRRVGGWVGVEV